MQQYQLFGGALFSKTKVSKNKLTHSHLQPTEVFD